MSPGRAPRQRQRAVREGKLETTLDRFNSEIGEKQAQALAKYHELFVEPELSKLGGELDVLRGQLGEARAETASLRLEVADLIAKLHDRVDWLEMAWWRRFLLTRLPGVALWWQVAAARWADQPELPPA